MSPGRCGPAEQAGPGLSTFRELTYRCGAQSLSAPAPSRALRPCGPGVFAGPTDGRDGGSAKRGVGVDGGMGRGDSGGRREGREGREDGGERRMDGERERGTGAE